MSRTYQIKDNEVVYYSLHPHRNHSRIHYSTRTRGWLKCKSKTLAHFLGWVWINTGLKISSV